MLELAVLKGLLDPVRYKEYRTFIDPKVVFTAKEHQKILEIIDEEHQKQGTDVTELAVVVRGKLKANGSDVLPKMLDDFQALDISESLFDETFETIKKRNIATEIALKAIKVSDGAEEFDSLISYVEEHKETKLATTEDINIVSLDITTYEDEEDNLDTLHWSLEWLNKSLGPVRRGNLGHLFATPETGKTAFWISQVTHMAKTVKAPIVIFFNEEAYKEVVYRMYSSMLQIPYKEVILNKTQSRDAFLAAGGNKIIFMDEAPLRTNRMERVLAKYNPAFCVIDNADKIRIKTQERRDLEIHNIYKWAREMAKQYCPILTVAHADASAYGVKYLDESMMANSKVGKPAEMDYIIGIGREEGESVARYLSLPKNKLRGDANTVETLRHGHWPVALISDISTFKDTVSSQGNET
jgi:replicative DNA helicase